MTATEAKSICERTCKDDEHSSECWAARKAWCDAALTRIDTMRASIARANRRIGAAKARLTRRARKES